MKYQRSITYGGYQLRIEADGPWKAAYHQGKLVAKKTGDMGLLLFEVVEHGERALYDIAVVATGKDVIRSFVGRNGDLIFSDDLAFPVDKTDAANRA